MVNVCGPDSLNDGLEYQSQSRRKALAVAPTPNNDKIIGRINVNDVPAAAPRLIGVGRTDSRTIPDFAWSRDGKRLAIARMTVTNDIVLFKGLKR
jgi:hypothetical protein